MSEGQGFVLEVVTPAGKAYEGRPRWISVMASDGLLEVHPGHAPMVASLGDGAAVLQLEGGGKEMLAIFGGVLHVERERTTILSPRVEPGRTIDGEAVMAQMRALEATLATATPAEAAAARRKLAEAEVRVEAWRGAEAQARTAS